MNFDQQKNQLSVHIWWIQLARYQTDVEKLYPILSDREQKKADRFRFASDRHRYILSHGCCRLILSQYLHISAKEIEWGEGVDGKPFVKYPQKPTIHFNLTHAGDLAAVALSTKPVGIDIEQVDLAIPFDELSTQFMSSKEQAIFQSLPIREKPTAFYCCWTRKEAYVKALGRGLAYPIQQVTVSLKKDQIEPWEDDYDPAERSRWQMFHLPAPAGYEGAVVCQGEKLVYFSMEEEI